MDLVWKLFLGDRFCKEQNVRTISRLQWQCQTRGSLHGVERSSAIVYNTTLLSPPIFEVSWACLRFEVTQMRDADQLPLSSTRGNSPFRKGGSEPGWVHAREKVPALRLCSTAPSLFSSTLPPCGSQVEIQTDAHVQAGGTSCSFGCSLGQSCWQQMQKCLVRKCLVPESIQLLMIDV